MRLLFALAILVLVAVFVWPTRYQTFAPDEGPHAAEVPAGTATRVDRFTGALQAQQTDGAWVPIGQARTALPFAVPPVDPNARRGPSRAHDESIYDAQQQNAARTQQAVTGTQRAADAAARR